MLNSGKKICALRDKKNKYSNSRVVRKKISERNKKTYPPLQVKWSVPYWWSGRNWCTCRKPPSCRKSLTNFIT